MIGSLPLVYLMGTRHRELAAAVAGFRLTGVPLVGLDHAGRLYAVGVSDDVGLHFFVSLIAGWTGMSAEASASVFLYGLLGLALAAGTWGWWRYGRSVRARVLLSAAMLPLAWVAVHFGDVYIVLTATPIACVPYLLALWRRGAPPTRWRWALFATGLLAGVASLVRADAGVVVLAFAAVLVLARTREAGRERALQTAVLVLGMLLPTLALRGAQLHRDAYLEARVAGYEAPAPVHMVWHGIYIGLGLLSNDQGIQYDDAAAGRLVQRLAPGTKVLSRRYVAVLRHEVLRLVEERPAFVARTIFAKLGILFMYVLVFGNVGLVAAVRARKPAVLELAFAAAIALAALPGVLVFPALYYLEGFATLVALYGVVSLDWALAGRRTSP